MLMPFKKDKITHSTHTRVFISLTEKSEFEDENEKGKKNLKLMAFETFQLLLFFSAQ
jgi:hypothetical protein